MKNIIAWQGVAKLKKAQWDTSNGYTVQFSLPDPEGDDKSNPFKRFTKMRKGRVGTQFEAIIFETVENPAQVYNDGAMLKGWTDSNTGQTVSFWLANVEGGEHPMAAYTEGTEFAIALVEMTEDSAPVDQVKRERAEEVAKPRHQQTPAEGCAIICNNPIFWSFIEDEYKIQCRSKEDAACTVRAQLNISSRRELNENKDAADRWDEIRHRFVEWQNQ